MFRRVIQSLRSLFQKQKVEQELDKELRFHIDMEIKKGLENGMNPKEARDAAYRRFGGMEQVKEECRDLRAFTLIDTLWQDIRFGTRILVKNLGFTLVAILTLALGIGANTAIFSVIYGVLLRPLPYAKDEQLVVLSQQATKVNIHNAPFSVKEFNDYKERNQCLGSMVEYHSMQFILLSKGEPERVQTGVVSAEFFDFLGVKPLLGRTFLPGEDQPGSEPVLVLSYGYWQRSHGGDLNIIGKSFKMNDRAHTVVGVLPQIPQYPDENDLYMTVSACPFRSSEMMIQNRQDRMINVFGRLKPGITIEQARSDLMKIAGQLLQEYPDSYPSDSGYGATLSTLREELTHRARPTLLILLATAGLVLIIACANVANLALARLFQREREIAVRAALGASQNRLIRQLLTESTLLSIAGGVLGLFFAIAGLKLLIAFAARFTTRASEISIDSSVLIFTLAISIITGLAFGVMPAFSSKQNLITPFKEGLGRSTIGVGRHRFRGLLLISQVAISFILLIVSGLMLRSVIKLQQVDPGFNPEKVLTMQINLNWSKYTNGDQVRTFFNTLLGKINSQPGISSAAVAFTFPLRSSGPEDRNIGHLSRQFQIEGRPTTKGEMQLLADFRVVSPDYFETLHVPLLGGRIFTDMDNERAPKVAMINRSMARHRWDGEDPIGKKISLDDGQTWTTIIGVVGDVRQYGLDKEPIDELYLPFAQNPVATSILVRTLTEPMSIAQQVREAVYSIDPEQPVAEVQTLEQVRENSLDAPRLTTILLGLFSGLALTIMATGIAGVMALSVCQRTHEIGIRMALGATRWEVLRMVLGQGMKLILMGLSLGIAGALAVTRLMSTLLFGIEPTDPVTFITVSMLLITVAAISCLIPASRVTAIDPMIALRTD
ncbi:MAG: ABC transporter permease [Acidobacteriota bacterium]